MVKRKKKKDNNDKPTQFLKIKVKKKKVKVGEEYQVTYKKKKKYLYTIYGGKTKEDKHFYGKEIKSVKKVPIYKEKKEIQITSPALREAARKRLQLPKLKKYRKYLVPEKRVRIRIGKKR